MCILTHSPVNQAHASEGLRSVWVTARGVLQTILLYVQKSNKSRLNNVSHVKILRGWLCVDCHHITNSLTAVTPLSQYWSLVALVLASLATLCCVECRAKLDKSLALSQDFLNPFITIANASLTCQKILSKLCFTLITSCDNSSAIVFTSGSVINMVFYTV